MMRNRRGARPAVEGLEGRSLLSGATAQAAAITTTSTTPAAETRFGYTTPQGSHVVITLRSSSFLNAPGTLAGTSVDASGDLNLVFSGTSVFSQIGATVTGGTGQANLLTIRNAGAPLDSLSGLGSELIGRVLLPQFNLVSGGKINLLGGVQKLELGTVAANAEVHLRDTPLNTTLGLASYVNEINGYGLKYAQLSAESTGATSSSSSGLSSGSSIGVATGSSTGGVSVNSAGTLDPTAVGFGGGSVGSINGPIPIINTVGNGQNFLGTPGLGQTAVSQGRSLSYTANAAGGSALTSIAGTFMPGANLIEPRDVSKSSHRVPPPGVIVSINHVNGGPTVHTPPLADAEIFGVDLAAKALIRFDARTGVALQSIPLPSSTSTVGGVSLARDGTELVALVGSGGGVLAFDAVTGASVGGFSISSLAGEGFTAVTGIATGGDSTVLADSADGANGTIQAINVQQSLANGVAVAVGSPTSPTREFGLAGTVTGVPGTGNIYALGAGFFDTSQPNLKQVGVLSVTPGTNGLTESSRTALTTSTTSTTSTSTSTTSTGTTSTSTGTVADVPAGPNNGIAGSPSVAIGSLDAFLAIDTGVSNGHNTIRLVAPNGLSSQGSFTLDDANPLADLSQSFHPELTNTALIDVQGNIQSFTAGTVTGLVLNDAGNFDQLTVRRATNSTIIGEPFSHVNIGTRANVSILTNSRLVGPRNGVTVVPTLKEVGPLTLP